MHWYMNCHYLWDFITELWEQAESPRRKHTSSLLNKPISRGVTHYIPQFRLSPMLFSTIEKSCRLREEEWHCYSHPIIDYVFGYYVGHHLWKAQYAATVEHHLNAGRRHVCDNWRGGAVSRGRRSHPLSFFPVSQL